MTKNASPSYDTTLYVRDHCLCLHTQRAARALARHFDQALAPAGITNGQFSLLMSLNRPEPPTMGAVARLLVLDRTTLTAALKPLERRGFLRVRVDKEDKRQRRIILTALGKKTLTAALPIWRREHATVEKLLNNPDQTRADLMLLS